MTQVKKIVRPITKECRINKCGFDHTPADDFVKSQWQNCTKSTIYFIYRWLIAIFFIGVVINSIVDNGLNGYYFIYLTHWGIIMCMITHLLGAYLVTLWHYHPEYADKVKDSNSMPKQFKIYWAMHITTLIVSLIITIVYWSLLYNETVPLSATNILTHVFNSGMMFLDLLIVAYPVRILHVFLPLIFGIIYASFSAIYYWAGGTDGKGNNFIYTVLNWSRPDKAIVTVIGVLMLVCFIHTFIFAVYKLRRFIYRRFIEKSTILPTTTTTTTTSAATTITSVTSNTTPVVRYPPTGISMALGDYGHDNKAFSNSFDKISGSS